MHSLRRERAAIACGWLSIASRRFPALPTKTWKKPHSAKCCGRFPIPFRQSLLPLTMARRWSCRKIRKSAALFVRWPSHWPKLPLLPKAAWIWCTARIKPVPRRKRLAAASIFHPFALTSRVRGSTRGWATAEDPFSALIACLPSHLLREHLEGNLARARGNLFTRIAGIFGQGALKHVVRFVPWILTLASFHSTLKFK